MLLIFASTAAGCESSGARKEDEEPQALEHSLFRVSQDGVDLLQRLELGDSFLCHVGAREWGECVHVCVCT